MMLSTSTLIITTTLEEDTPKSQESLLMCTTSTTLSIAITSSASSTTTTTTSATTAMVSANGCHSRCNSCYRGFCRTNKEHEENCVTSFMFATESYVQARRGNHGTSRFVYLQRLVTEYQDTQKPGRSFYSEDI